MKIGLYGGSFNPVHNDHLKIALYLIKNCYLEKIIFIPTGNNYPKNNIASIDHRINMLKLALEKKFSISDYEKRNKRVYTYETLNYFKNKYPNDEIYFITGADNINEITIWKNYKYILDNYKIIVINRNNLPIPNYKNIILVDLGNLSISSTKIRNELNNNNYDLKKYLNHKVLDYIIKNKLYKGENNE